MRGKIYFTNYILCSAVLVGREKGAEQHIYMHICTYIMSICIHREAKIQLTTAAAIVLVTTGRQEFWLALEDKSTWWYL